MGEVFFLDHFTATVLEIASSGFYITFCKFGSANGNTAMAKKNLIYIGVSFVLVIFLQSCESQTAKQFLDTIDQQERIATDILIGEKGSESQKLEHMINNNFDSALLVNGKQQIQFDSIIGTIEALPAQDLKQGKALQTASIQYYKALKSLYGYAKEEIEQQKILLKARGDEQVKAQDRLMDLTRNKQALFQSVYQADSVFAESKKQFAQEYKLTP